MLHLNGRNLLPKLDDIDILINKTNPTCFCITVTWLNESVYDNEINIPNYAEIEIVMVVVSVYMLGKCCI